MQRGDFRQCRDGEMDARLRGGAQLLSRRGQLHSAVLPG